MYITIPKNPSPAVNAIRLLNWMYLCWKNGTIDPTLNSFSADFSHFLHFITMSAPCGMKIYQTQIALREHLDIHHKYSVLIDHITSIHDCTQKNGNHRKC
eukprot:399008_1